MHTQADTAPSSSPKTCFSRYVPVALISFAASVLATLVIQMVVQKNAPGMDYCCERLNAVCRAVENNERLAAVLVCTDNREALLAAAGISLETHTGKSAPKAK